MLLCIFGQNHFFCHLAHPRQFSIFCLSSWWLSILADSSCLFSLFFQKIAVSISYLSYPLPGHFHLLLDSSTLTSIPYIIFQRFQFFLFPNAAFVSLIETWIPFIVALFTSWEEFLIEIYNSGEDLHFDHEQFPIEIEDH